MLVHIRDIVEKASKGGYAVGAFNVHNVESVLGVAKAALRAESPVIIQVSESVIKYMGLKPITHIVSTVAKNLLARVPVALHLDHGKSLNSIFECINSGFTSVHIDASNLPLDENIALTKQVVSISHNIDEKVWVQGEVGMIMGDHGGTGIMKNIPIADINDVVKFVKETEIDTLAAAIGTAHGVHRGERIIFELLKDIKNKTKMPFVLHGGSGIPDKEVRRGIKGGINIINIGSDIKIAFCKTLISVCAKNKKETDPRVLLKPCIDAVAEVVYDKMKLFGSAGKAKYARFNV